MARASARSSKSSTKHRQWHFTIACLCQSGLQGMEGEEARCVLISGRMVLDDSQFSPNNNLLFISMWLFILYFLLFIRSGFQPCLWLISSVRETGLSHRVESLSTEYLSLKLPFISPQMKSAKDRTEEGRAELGC